LCEAGLCETGLCEAGLCEAGRLAGLGKAEQVEVVLSLSLTSGCQESPAAPVSGWLEVTLTRAGGELENVCVFATKWELLPVQVVVSVFTWGSWIVSITTLPC